MSIPRYTHNGYVMEQTDYGAYMLHADYARDTARLAKLERFYAAVVRAKNIHEAVWGDPEDVANANAAEDEARAAMDDLHRSPR